MPRDNPLDPKTPRVFGSLKDVVRVDAEFFAPSPKAEQNAWDGDSERESSQTEKGSEAPNADDPATGQTP
jgi:hypothetical protein